MTDAGPFDVETYEARRGRPIPAGFADALRDLTRSGKVRVSGVLGLAGTGSAGRPAGSAQVVAHDPMRPFVVKLTAKDAGAGSHFSWTEQIATAGGTWADGPRSGTYSADPLVELNGNAGITLGGTIRARAWRDDAGTLRFQRGTC